MGVTAVATSLNGKLIVTGGNDKKVKIWDATMLELKLSIETLHESAVTDLCFVPNQPLLLSSSERRNEIDYPGHIKVIKIALLESYELR